MKTFYLFLSLFIASALSAQCYMPQSMESRMADTDLAVVGRVIESVPFYNVYGEIYTMHTLAVGAIAGPVGTPDTVDFFTMGGRINEEQTIVYPSLRDIEGAEGIFLLKRYEGDRVVAPSGQPLYRPAAMHESYTSMIFEPQVAERLDSLGGGFGPIDGLLRQRFGTGMTLVSEEMFTERPPVEKLMEPSVTGISPRAVSAGIGDVITITGSNFGANRGSIFFDSPDDGPGGAFTGTNAGDILSWTNTRIRVQVVAEAGSGAVLVRTAGGQQVASAQQIDVDFAVSNLRLNSGAIVTPLLIDDEADGDGGYTYAIGNTSANNGRSLAGDAAALASLNRAVATWQRDGDYSIYLEGTTNIQAPSRDDDVNIVAFGSNAYDFQREFGSGTVGIAFSYYNSCGSSEFEVSGTDILFRRPGNNVTYNFGPGNGGGVDFESVALHEIGHTHQLKHVADPNEVMSFRITNGVTQRNISPDTRAGADYVAGLAINYTPPIINCPGDFSQERSYQSFSAVNGGALPVSWLDFSATAAGKTVRLAWATGSETDNDFFTVERSADGSNFAPVARVRATNLSEGATYETTDDLPLSGRSYYRIAQTDFSGASSFSEIREVTFTGAPLVSIFPNPVSNQLTLTDPTVAAGDRFRIIDGLGRVVRTVSSNRAGGLQANVTDLPAGQYLLRNERGTSVRFVK